MQIRKVKPINFLYFRVETRVNELSAYLAVGQELYREAIRENLAITGPVHWHYFGFNGDQHQSFTLEVALPVSGTVNDYDGKFHFKRTEDFTCVSLLHEGSWLDIPESYTRLMQFIREQNLQPVFENREIYTNVDLNYQDANITEIQIGIQQKQLCKG